MLCDLYALSCASRTPPLTLLHLSASKFSGAPSAGGIVEFLSSDISSTQSFSSTLTPSQLKNGSPCKQTGSIQSFFQKAVDKQKQKNVEDEGLPHFSLHKASTVEVLLRTDTNSPASSSTTLTKSSTASPLSGISSFFHKKSLERGLNKAETGQNSGPNGSEDSENSFAVVSGLQSKHSSEFKSHQSPCSELTGDLDADLDSNNQPLSIAREDLLKCERCGQDVCVWEMPEHNDYHFALDLQNSLSSSTSSANSTSTVSSSSSSASCASLAAGSAQFSRGKTKSKGQSGPQSKRQRSQGGSTGTLDSFFKRN